MRCKRLKKMSYDEAISHINELGKFGINLGLGRIEKLLKNMGNPQEKLKFIHIAGTNGKGSVSTMLTKILSDSGYKTGLFTSPFILCFRETMQINCEMIGEDELAECAQFVLHHWRNSSVNGEFPTQFEVTTAIAIEWFYRQKCDYVCMETGMGGGNDSTNIIPPPILQIFTSISLDHTSILGKNIAEITKEKSGIIKGGKTIVYPLMDEEAAEIIEKKCEAVGSEYIQPNLKNLEISDYSWRKSDFKYDGVAYHKSLSGEFQIYNAVTVITAIQELIKLGVKISDTSVCSGIKNVFIPARMEVLSEKPLVILDGSHNAGGATALVKTLENFKNQNITVLMGVLADKEYDLILQLIGKFATNFIAVEPNNPRALSNSELAKIANLYCKSVYNFENQKTAIDFAFEKTGKDDILVICGSLYLASDIRKLIVRT